MIRGVDDLDELTFLDLRTELVERELQRNRATRRSGPTAENLLRDVGAVGDPLAVRMPR
jgi:pyruvate ferredoxin oxidoreductase alpha subunit